MPISINGKKAADNTPIDKLYRGICNQNKIKVKNQKPDGYVPTDKMRLNTNEYAYVDKASDNGVHLISANCSMSNYGVYFFNENERLFLVTMGIADWQAIFANFKDRTHINVMILGLLYPTEHVTIDSAHTVERGFSQILTGLLTECIKTPDLHLNFVASRQEMEKSSLNELFPEMTAHYLFMKLNTSSQLHCGKPLARRVSLDNPESNFTVSLSSVSKKWLDIIFEYILIPSTKTNKVFLDLFPVEKSEVFEWMANALFTVEGFNKCREYFSKMPYLSDIAIDLDNHGVYSFYSDRVALGADSDHFKFAYTLGTLDPKPTVFYTSRFPNQKPLYIYPAKFHNLIAQWGQRMRDLENIELFCGMASSSTFIQLISDEIVEHSHGLHAQRQLDSLLFLTAMIRENKVKLQDNIIAVMKDFLAPHIQLDDRLRPTYACSFTEFIREVLKNPSLLCTLKTFENELQRIFPQYKGQFVFYEKAKCIDINVKNRDEAIAVAAQLNEYKMKVPTGAISGTSSWRARISCDATNLEILRGIRVENRLEVGVDERATSSTATQASN